MDRGLWQTTVHEVAESDMTEATQHACKILTTRGSLVVLVAKDPPANAGDIRDAGWTPGSGRSPGGRPGNPLVFLPEKLHRQRSLVSNSD